MKIISSACWKYPFSLRPEVHVEEGQPKDFENVVLCLETDTGLIGFGMAAPDMKTTGEDVDSVMHAYKVHIEPVLHSGNPFFFSRIYETLWQTIPSSVAALAMVEMALYDLIAQQAKVPLYQFLGGYRDKILTSITLRNLPDDLVMASLETHLQNGILFFKIKGGLDVERDIRIMHMIRKRAGKKILLNFDANEGYSLIEAAHFIRHTKDVNLTMFEQPTSKESTLQWHLLRQECDALIMADESLRKLSDAFLLTSRQAVDMLNIKLMKVGGLSPALQINSSARSADVACMMGCMNECSLGIAAGLHVALARPNISYTDLDSWMDIENDPFAGMVILDNGYLRCSDYPGLGHNNPKLI